MPKWKKEKYKSVPHFRLFFDVMFFFLSLSSWADFLNSVFYFPRSRFLLLFLKAELMLYYCDETLPLQGTRRLHFFNSSLLFLIWRHNWRNCLLLVLEPRVELIFFYFGEGMEVVRGSAVLYFLLFWLLFILGDFWQMCCRSVGIKAGRLRAFWP